MTSQKPITRFAPSPTGELHIGGARTALFNYLHAKHSGGKFLLRMEDTDAERSKQEFADAIMADLDWLGIQWDNDVVPYQSQRLDIYKRYLQKLLDKGIAYAKDGAVYLKGEDKVNDFVIFKSSGTPTFHFAVVIDDHEMGVNTIIRGVDHLVNTEKHVLIYKYLGLPIPKYYHVPLIVDENNKPLSKRRNDSSTVFYRENHFLPESVLNYLARLGWGYKNQEIFSKQELIDLFEVGKVSKNPAKFDARKLGWLNIQYIKSASVDRLREFDFKNLQLLIGLADKDSEKAELLKALQQKAVDIQELDSLIVPFLSDYENNSEVYADYQDFIATKLEVIKALYKSIDAWTMENLEQALKSFLESSGMQMKEVAMPLRFILTGQKKSLDLYRMMFFLGKDVVLERIETAQSI